MRKAGKRFPRRLVVTLRALVEFGACRKQRKVFARLFGKQAALTIPNTTKAFNAGLPWWWIPDRTLNGKAQEDFESYVVKAYRPYWSHYHRLTRDGTPHEGNMRLAKLEREALAKIAKKLVTMLHKKKNLSYNGLQFFGLD